MDLGDAKYTVKLDDQATGQMKSIGGSMDKMGANMVKVGAIMAAAAAAVTTAIGKMVSDWAAAGDEIMKTSQRMGWGVGAVAEMKYIAELSGTTLAAVETGQKKLAKAIVDADDGLATYVRDFEALGLSTKDLMQMHPEEQFWAVASALAAVENETLRSKLAVELFGRAGTDMFPMLAEGAEGVARMREEFEKTAYQWSEESTQAAVDLTDSVSNIKTAMEKLTFTIVQELGPEITKLIYDDILPAIDALTKFVDENNDLKQSFLDIVDAVKQVVAWIETLYGWYKKYKDFSASIINPDIYGFQISDVMSGKTAIKSYQNYQSAVGGMYATPGTMGTGASFNPGAGGPVGTITINVGNLMGNEAAIRQLVNELAPYMTEAQRRTTFAAVNSPAYFNGNSAT